VAQAKNGDTVKIHYKGTLDDGSVFDSSEGRDPLNFKLGEGMVIPGFENAVLGLNKGEKKTVKIPSTEAYGPKMDEAVIVVPKEEIPPHIKPEKGLKLQLMAPDGSPALVEVTDVTETHVTLDGNHPLAGKDLTFEIELVEIA
jgi:peptidylprolyl isomerase